ATVVILVRVDVVTANALPDLEVFHITHHALIRVRSTATTRAGIRDPNQRSGASAARSAVTGHVPELEHPGQSAQPSPFENDAQMHPQPKSQLQASTRSSPAVWQMSRQVEPNSSWAAALRGVA